VKPSYGLTDEEVERMLLESFEHAAADVEARVLIETRNEAETVIRATEKSLRNPDLEAAKHDLAPGELAAIESALADLRAAMTSSDRTVLEARTRVLNDVTRHLAEVMMNRGVRAALAGKRVDGV
jgi:molecular chaperone DnaK (HSP70)